MSHDTSRSNPHPRPDHSLSGNLAIIAGVLMLVAGVRILFWPTALTTGAWPQRLQAIATHVQQFRFPYLTLTLAALVGLGVVPVLTDRLRSTYHGAIYTLAIVASFGFVLTAVNLMFMQNAAVERATAYREQPAIYEGFGLYLHEQEPGDIWLTPLPDSPAERAGLMAGDGILAINGQPLRRTALVGEVYKTLCQAPEGRVTLTIQPADSKPREVQLVRREAPSRTFAAQHTISPFGVPALDAGHLSGYVLVGLWLGVTNGLARRYRALPRPLAAVGLVAAAGFLLLAAGVLFQAQALDRVGLVSGLTFGPLWLVGVGVMLRRESALPKR